ncbi:MAG: PD40 domain-containing protein, partial [Candidatus Krumholzibacteria bacterium]|nr:PD40 domain-containing protein [Candidatus Krumholzibacteria bacterium]
YVSDESGQPEIYVQPFPITGQKWRLSQNGGDTPKWSADGRTVYFLSGYKIMSVSIDTESGFIPGRAEILLEIEHTAVQYFDVFPDGKRFIVIGPKRATDIRWAIITPGALHRIFPTTTPELRVVVNWLSELR